MMIKYLLIAVALLMAGCGDSTIEPSQSVLRWDDSRTKKTTNKSLMPTKIHRIGDLVVPCANQILVGQVVNIYIKHGHETVWSYLVKYPIDSYESYFAYEIQSISLAEARKIWDRVNIIQVFDK